MLFSYTLSVPYFDILRNRSTIENGANSSECALFYSTLDTRDTRKFEIGVYSFPYFSINRPMHLLQQFNLQSKHPSTQWTIFDRTAHDLDHQDKLMRPHCDAAIHVFYKRDEDTIITLAARYPDERAKGLKGNEREYPINIYVPNNGDTYSLDDNNMRCSPVDLPGITFLVETDAANNLAIVRYTAEPVGSDPYETSITVPINLESLT